MSETKGGGVSASGKKVRIEKLETAREFKHYVRGRERVIVKWGMPGCGPCKIIAPAFEKLSETHPGLALAEAELTLPALKSIAETFKVTSVPLFHFFHAGKHIPEFSYQGTDPKKLNKLATALLNRPKDTK